MLSGKILPKIIVALLLALAFVGVGVGLSYAVCGGINEMVVIVTVTTLAICASFCRKIRELPKTFEMGMVLIIMFSVVVASQFDFYMLRTTIVTLVYFVLFVLLVSILLHFIVCKITPDYLPYLQGGGRFVCGCEYRSTVFTSVYSASSGGYGQQEGFGEWIGYWFGWLCSGNVYWSCFGVCAGNVVVTLPKQHLHIRFVLLQLPKPSSLVGG